MPVEQEEKKIPKALRRARRRFRQGGTADSEMECLAGAIYFESKGEPLAGQLAVAEVIINRSQSGRYPRTLCGRGEAAEPILVRPRRQDSRPFPRTARIGARPWRSRISR
jgi:hypothetical protein